MSEVKTFSAAEGLAWLEANPRQVLECVTSRNTVLQFRYARTGDSSKILQTRAGRSGDWKQPVKNVKELLRKGYKLKTPEKFPELSDAINSVVPCGSSSGVVAAFRAIERVINEKL